LAKVINKRNRKNRIQDRQNHLGEPKRFRKEKIKNPRQKAVGDNNKSSEKGNTKLPI